MGVSEQIQDLLREGRSAEEVLDHLRSKGLSEANAKKFLERAQTAMASSPGPVPRPSSPPTAGARAARSYAPADDDDDDGTGTWPMVTGLFFFMLGISGTALTFIVAKPGGKFLLLYGAVIFGLGNFLYGLLRWWRVRGQRVFPTVPVAAATVLPVVIMVGIYVKRGRDREAGRERVAQMIREEQQRRGVDGVAPDPVSAYLVVLRQSPDEDQRREAVWRLGEMRGGARDAVPGLIVALRDRGSRVRAGAFEALNKIAPEDPTVLAALKPLMADASSEVWRPAVGHFAARGDADALESLRAKLEDPNSRGGACSALGTLRDNAAFAAPLIASRLSDPDYRVRMACVSALGALGHATPEIVATLKQMAESDPHAWVKRPAQDALATLERAAR